MVEETLNRMPYREPSSVAGILETDGDARRKAQIYAKAAAVTLGEPLSISEETAPTPVFRGKVAGGMAASAAPVAQGEETLSVTVNVSWAIKPKE